MDKKNTLPDFLIIGAMKAGTSTLADYLSLHSEIHVPEREVHFFDRDQNFQQGPRWYSDKLISGKDETVRIVGEKTPTYSFKPECAQRIRDTIPDIKLIWIFRDPVKRTFSNYLHAKKNGADFVSFSKALSGEKKRMEQNIFFGYAERSIYVKQVEHFLRFFKKEQMHFLLYENLISKSHQELNKIARFLKVQPFENELPKIHSNPTKMPLFPFSLWAVSKVFGNKSFFYKGLYKLNYLFPREKPKLSDELISKLEKQFKPYNQQLSNLTGLDLSLWEAKASI